MLVECKCRWDLRWLLSLLIEDILLGRCGGGLFHRTGEGTNGNAEVVNGMRRQFCLSLDLSYLTGV